MAHLNVNVSDDDNVAISFATENSDFVNQMTLDAFVLLVLGCLATIMVDLSLACCLKSQIQ